MSLEFPISLLFLCFLITLWIFYFFKIKNKFFLLANSSKRVINNVFYNINPASIKWKNRFIITGTIFLGLAASGPQIGTKVKQVERRGIDLVIALDISVSMDAEDVTPSRLKKAKFELSQLIKSLNGDRVSIIVFAGTSFLYLPLTSDYEAAILFLNQIDTKMIASQGTNLSSAINTAVSAFTNDLDKHKVMLIVSDGEDHEGQSVDLAKKASKNGFIIHTVGVGSNMGGLIPLVGDNLSFKYKKDKSNKLITTVLNKDILKDIALAGLGNFFWFDNNRDTHKNIKEAIEKMEKKTISTNEFSEFENRYQYFVLISIFSFMVALILPTNVQS